MKISALAISLAFLGGSSHFASGANPIDSTLQKDGICSVVRNVNVCPPKDLALCTYETIDNDYGAKGFHGMRCQLRYIKNATIIDPAFYRQAHEASVRSS